MSEIRDKVDKQIIHILDVWHNFSKGDTEDIKWRKYFIDQILSIPEIAQGLEAVEKGWNAKVADGYINVDKYYQGFEDGAP